MKIESTVFVSSQRYKIYGEQVCMSLGKRFFLEILFDTQMRVLETGRNSQMLFDSKILLLNRSTARYC